MGKIIIICLLVLIILRLISIAEKLTIHHNKSKENRETFEKNLDELAKKIKNNEPNV